MKILGSRTGNYGKKLTGNMLDVENICENAFNKLKRKI
jgi:hypothetical protein